MANHPNRNKEASRLRLVIRDLIFCVLTAKSHLSPDCNRRLIDHCDKTLEAAWAVIGETE